VTNRAAGSSRRHPGETADTFGTQGWAALHLFCDLGAGTDQAAAESALARCQADGYEVVTVEILGHKADLGVLALGPSFERLRELQSELRHAGCEPRYSYVSATEVSEYAARVPEEGTKARLHPKLPPEGMLAFCFYPMSRRRRGDDNWYLLSHAERLRMMINHGKVGSAFRGRVVQLVTGSSGLDDWEWGVTLFGATFDDIKSCVYTMRFDEASARYGEFGPFLTGTVRPPAAVFAQARRAQPEPPLVP
jgi:chlorite dismutase